MLDGNSLLELGPEIGVLLLWGIVPFFVGLKIFRWE